MMTAMDRLLFANVRTLSVSMDRVARRERLDRSIEWKRQIDGFTERLKANSVSLAEASAAMQRWSRRLIAEVVLPLMLTWGGALR